MLRSLFIPISFACLLAVSPASAQLISYPDPCLNYIYPAGGKQGETVSVEFGAVSGLDQAQGVIVDGPPGITVSEFK
ncbi:MAG: hypothetical protein JWN70_3751, partial [Planctomycetaceae bacterium]|nr:hypothetical protein [Planctomycetaceae bacterium]